VEAIFGLIGLVLFWVAFNWVIRAGFGTVRAVARTASGKGSFTDNFQASVVGMKPIEVRLWEDNSTDGIEAKEIQVKGLLPISNAYHLGFITSVFDDTSGKYEPVTSSIDQFQEARTLAYQHAVDVGTTEPGIGFIGWVRVGVVLPQLLGTPYGGRRQLVAVIRLVNLDNKPEITNGFHNKDESGILWQRALPFSYEIKAKGYLEIEESRNAARALCLKVAMVIAMWDGSLNNREGELLKAWIEKVLGSYSGERRDKLKESLNKAMKEAYSASKNNTLDFVDLVRTLKETGDEATKYETIELCYDLLASKGTTDGDSARVIDLVAKSLDLDMTELEKIRDVKIVGLAGVLSRNYSVEQLLVFYQSWDSEKIKRHLRNEFQKWNNRLTALPEGADRDSAQRMLDAISEARKRYG
jgi:hypothetical protein